jgi:hypothetical protein
VLRGAVKTEGDRLSADFDLIAPDKKRVGRISQEFRFARRGERNIVDVRATIHADAGPIRMGDTEEGSLGIRFADEFREDRGAILMNSDRLTGTDQIWGKRAKWVDYSTKLKGETAGVLILDHPSNPKYPTFWHARGYGLNAANPFGEHDFFSDKTRDGGITIPAAGSLTFDPLRNRGCGGVRSPGPGVWSAVAAPHCLGVKSRQFLPAFTSAIRGTFSA